MTNAKRSPQRKVKNVLMRWLRVKDAGSVAAVGVLLHYLAVAAYCGPVRFGAEGNRSIGTIPSVERSEGVCLSLPHLCELVGGTWHWDVLTGELRCSRAGRNLSFVQDMHFYEAGDSIVQLHSAPFRGGGDLYLAAGGAAEAFSYLAAAPLRWRPDESAMILGDMIHKGATAGSTEAGSANRGGSSVRVLPDQPRGEAITTIVIDAGHGGRDPGAVGPGGTKEKDVVLGVALALQSELQKCSDLTVYMTRSTDVFVELRDRTKFANDKNADLFVSIHANSIGGSRKKREQVKGYKVYFLSHAKSEDDRRVAMLENSVVEFEKKESGGNFLQNILMDMAASEYLLESQEVSIMLAETFSSKLRKVRKLHTGVGQGPFWVLYGATMPSVLVETGFISNPREEKILADQAFQKELASVIREAILEFKKKYERGL
ncbi:MAG: hypothetical protein GF344_02945 [Chitinivibrionales bacterium]|nr:hypothetical protein [Chitinivibrionales bacterium]MBD3356036.1 hypothetical protein [Chitinivibrionales bacterium]